MNKQIEYPTYICTECANKLSAVPKNAPTTHHRGQCGWCKKQKVVTGARNWGYPPYEGKEP